MSLIDGPRHLLKGLRLIKQPGLRHFAIMPLLINTLLFATLITLGVNQFAAFIDSLLPEWLNWLAWLLWPLFAIGVLVVGFYTFTLIANLIAAPFNTLLAQAVERHLTGNTTQESSQSFVQILKEGSASFASELRKLGFFLVRAIPLLLLFWIPGINLIAPFLWLAFGAWMLALEYLDYPMANHDLKFPEQRSLLRQYRLSGFSFGGTVMLLTMIPVVNFFVMPMAVAAATSIYLEKIANGRH